MDPRRPRGCFHRALAAAVSAAVAASSFGPGTAALAADVGGARRANSAELGRRPPVALKPIPQALSSLSPGGALFAAPATLSAALEPAGASSRRAEAAPAPAEPVGEVSPSGESAVEAKGRADEEFRRLGAEPAGTKRGAAAEAVPAAAAKNVFENALGHRWVRNVVHDASLGRLPSDADVPRIIKQISAHFDIDRDTVLDLARQAKMDESSPRAAWLAVYDDLQAQNRQHYNRWDMSLAHTSFRNLANVSYAAGWRGRLQRVLEWRKHLVGLAFRMPYHLFDMFFYGYFRRAWMFEFVHARKDYLSLSGVEGLARKALSAAFGRQAARGTGPLSELRARGWFRGLERWVWVPLAAPLANFMVRRLTLAVLSSGISVGLLAALTPALPLVMPLVSGLGAFLAPLHLGATAVWALNSFPVAVAAIPFVGHFFASIISAALAGFVPELAFAALLKTFVLSTLLTFPREWSRLRGELGDRQARGRLTWGQWAQTFLGAWGSRSFWRANASSFVGLLTVGAEIGGILNYAEQLDAGIDTVFHPVTGTHFHAIYAFADFVDGHNGAITWGSWILAKAQELAHFQLSDAVMSALSFGRLQGSAEEAVHAAAGDSRLAFDPDLWSKPPAEAEARIQELAAEAGGLEREAASVREHSRQLLARLEDQKSRLEKLRRESRPETARERAEGERLLKELAGARDKSYVLAKLAERHDLDNPAPEGLRELRRLRALQERYNGILLPPPDKRDGHWEALALREASARAMASRLKTYAGDGDPGGRSTAASPAESRITGLVDQIESMSASLETQVARSQNLQNALQAANRARNDALRARDMGPFISERAKTASTMELARYLRVVEDALAALQPVIDDTMQARREKIERSRQDNQRSQQTADDNRAKLDQWRKEAQQTLAEDDKTQQDIRDNKAKAESAALAVGSFQEEMTSILGQLDSDYQRRLDLLPKIQRWREEGGNPEDPGAFSVRKFQDSLAKVQDNIRKAQEGLPILLDPATPDEAAGLMVARIPGPEEALSSPNRAQMLALLDRRARHWEAERDDYRSSHDSVLRLLGRADSQGLKPGRVRDEFGDEHPESLEQWRTEASQERARAQSAARRSFAALDAVADKLDAATHSSLPRLSGLDLAGLKEAVKTYGDSLRSVRFPAGDESAAMHAAKMDLIAAAKLVPGAAMEVIRWAKADATIAAIDKARADVLPSVESGLKDLLTMFGDILADVSADKAFVAGGAESGAALKARKIVLLRDKILPPLRGAETMLGDKLLVHQRESVKQASRDGELFELYDAQKTLMAEATKLYRQTMPWALATFGAAEGNAAAARDNIADWTKSLQRRIDGYDDAPGHHLKGLTEYQVEAAQRKDPNYAGTEDLYGEPQPRSLPKKIEQYGAEKIQRAAQINAEGAVVNEILGKIEALSGGRHDLRGLRLPTDIAADAAGVARAQGVVDARILPDLAERLKAIAGEAAASAGGMGIGGGNGTLPSGPQPPITIGDKEKIRLLALQAAERLVPADPARPDGAPAAYALARFLFSDAVVAGARANLDRIPQIEAFLQRGVRVLGNAVAEASFDRAYADSNGSSETPEEVYARKKAGFAALESFLAEGVAFFDLKKGWDGESSGTIDRVETYYDSLHDIYDGAQTVNENEVKAIDAMEQALRQTQSDLLANRQKLTSWLAQLNPREMSAQHRLGDALSRLQEQTRSGLEAHIKWGELENRSSQAGAEIQEGLAALEAKRRELAEEVFKPEMQDTLSPELTRRVEDLRLGSAAWALADAKAQTESMVVKKSDYPAFLDAMLGLAIREAAPRAARQDLSELKRALLDNPLGLTGFLPGARIADFGDEADGFYVLYQSRFAVPHGLETGTWVTLGNVAQVMGSHVNVTGYAFSSPPSVDGSNPPVGDRGVLVEVRSQTDRALNYLDVNLHRFALDIPRTNAVMEGALENRLMIFDDLAMMLMDGRLYVGLAGFGDVSIDNSGEKPSYYGASAKTSLRLNNVMTLDVQQQEMFAKDPRKFLQTVNLDFTGYDHELDKTISILDEGGQKRYSRTQAGAGVDLKQVLGQTSADSMTLDLFYAKTSGTDDINQTSAGATLLTGFSIKDDQKRAWLNISNRLTAEKGQVVDSYGDRLSFTFPDKGLAIGAEGRLAGSKGSYYFEAAKKVGDHATTSVGYGSQMVGRSNRLSLTMNTEFTVGEMWRGVAKESARNISGGDVLTLFNREMDAFFADGPGRATPAESELAKVFKADIARRLISSDIGALARDIKDLRKAGAVLDNTRVRGMVGFTSRAISNDLVERAASGGPVAGLYTEMTLTEDQKALLESKAPALYREGLRLQDRLLQLTKDWQATVVELASAQWDLKLAGLESDRAVDEPARREAEARLAEAQGRLHRAVLDYNALSGRDLAAGSPFDNLNAGDLRRLMDELGAMLAAPDRLVCILGALEPAELEKALGPDPFNLVNFLPWVDKLAVGFGVQYQDMMSSQLLTVGGSVRLPVYDPSADGLDRAYRLEGSAARLETAQVYADRRLAAAGAAERARAWRAKASALEAGVPAAASLLDSAVREYREGKIGPAELRRSFEAWRWYAQSSFEAQSQSALADAQAAVDKSLLPEAAGETAPVSLSSLEDAFKRALSLSPGLEALAQRSQAADETARASDQRVRKFWVDMRASAGLTATGLSWVPSLGITGIGILPVFGLELKPEELRELEVRQGQWQKEYHDALKTQLEAGLAVRFHQNAMALRAAEARRRVYEREILPRLEASAAGGALEDVRRRDEARIELETAALAAGEARATLNLLLGRAERAPLEIDMDESRARGELASILAEKNPVAAQQRLLRARVEAARAAQEIVDKKLRVEAYQVEPVSLIARGVGRALKALSDGSDDNGEEAQRALHRLLAAEQAERVYDGQRQAEAARLRLRLNASAQRLAAVEGGADGASRLEVIERALEISSLQAGLLALGETPGQAQGFVSAEVPSRWSDVKSLLVEAEKSLVATEAFPDIESPAAEAAGQRSSSYLRYYRAIQTLGRAPIHKSYIESWVELRLKDDPNTPADVYLKLAQLHRDRDENLRRAELAGAAARAEALAAEFESDVRLLRWVDRERRRPGGESGRPLEAFRPELVKRLEAERERIVVLLNLPARTRLEELSGLVPEESVPLGPVELAGRLIADIRERQLDSVRRTLFGAGAPANFGREEDLIGQIKADRIAERMSYQGVNLVFMAGVFRGQTIYGGALEAPDPRAIERSLENVVSETLRRDLQASGRNREMALHFQRLLVAVQDGSRQLEAQGRLVEASEKDLRARAVLAEDSGGVAEVKQAEDRLVRAWADFSRLMVETKSSFIRLVSELKALEKASVAILRPRQAAFSRESLPLRHDARSELLDFWTERLAEEGFESESDALLARTGASVGAELRASLRQAARDYRQAFHETRDDVEGKRRALRSAIVSVLGGLETLDPHAGPAAGEIVRFFQAEAEKAAQAGTLERSAQRAIAVELRKTSLRAAALEPRLEAAFLRLEDRAKVLDEAREDLLAASLSNTGDVASRFVLSDKSLDRYLKAQTAFDDELIGVLESRDLAKDPSLARILDGLHDVRGCLARASSAAKYGRGMAAIDALIMIEEVRLRGARWAGRPSEEIDRAAGALESLRAERARWAAGKTELQPVYAVTLRDGDARTWTVDRWLTAEEFATFRKGGEIVERGGRFFIDRAADGSNTQFEVIGGVDAAEALRRGTLEALRSNAELADLHTRLEDSDFVLLGGPAGASEGRSFNDVFDPDSLRPRGGIFFFDANGGAALNATQALSRRPEEIVIMVHAGRTPPTRGLFPNLESLRRSEEGQDFRELLVSPSGAAKLAEAARAGQAEQLRRGWIELKLNGFGFARDGRGRVVDLYLTREDFDRALRARPEDRTLHRSEDLVLTLDGQGAVVRAEAPAAGGTLSLGESVPGGGPGVVALSGSLAAAIVDRRGRLVQSYATREEADRASAAWTPRSYALTGDVSLLDDTGRVLTKVRFNRYEDPARLEEDGRPMPVLLSGRYMLDRLKAAESRRGSLEHWAAKPYNWGNIVLEPFRSLVQAPLEILGARDPNRSPFLDRANMYKSEGGLTEHHGVARSVLAVADVFDVLPDPVERYNDPSQFPEVVAVDSPLTPGQGLFDKSPRNAAGDKDVHFGVPWLQRQERYAREDLEAARERTLARFNGGLEQVLIKSLRGRGRLVEDGRRVNDYQESSLKVRSGRVGELAEDEVVSESPGAVFVDGVEKRVRIHPGAAGYGDWALAVDGYGERSAQRAQRTKEARPGLEEARALAERGLDAHLREREAAAAEERVLVSSWHRLAERLGAQKALERRIAELEASVKTLEARRAWWGDYLRRLEEARARRRHSAFWAWAALLAGLGGLLAALWHVLFGRGRRPLPA